MIRPKAFNKATKRMSELRMMSKNGVYLYHYFVFLSIFELFYAFLYFHKKWYEKDALRKRGGVKLFRRRLFLQGRQYLL